MQLYADVILPLAVSGIFSYALTGEMKGIRPGMRVAVPFGRGRKLYGGLVRRIHDQRPLHRNVREVLSVIDHAPIVTEAQFLLWERIADHYLCTVGEVMIAALPAQLSLSSETRLVAGKTADLDLAVKGRASVLLDVLAEKQVITLHEAGDLLNTRDPMPIVRNLMEKGALVLEEELRDTWKPRMVDHVLLTAEASTEEALHSWFDRLEKAPKQLHVLMRYIELSQLFSDRPKDVERNMLLRLSGATSSVLDQLVKKGLFRIDRREAGTPWPKDGKLAMPKLSPAQVGTLHQAKQAFREKNVVLLHGVTSSGKTEVYITLIQEAIERGEQVLYLLPEIALTGQIIARLRERFGDRVAVAHSRMAQRDRTELWLRSVQGDTPPSVVVGARSALFLPFKKLGLVIVDEEHDPSYKQQEPAPRYNARDMSIVLADLHRAKVILGSATPSLESLHNVATGKFGHAQLLVRYGEVALPNITRVDLRDAQKRKQMRGHFSTTLIEAIEDALAKKEQAIIFQNRRGYVPVWQCETCGWVPGCDHCDVSLTYHKFQHQLRCHYCGVQYPPPRTCANCGSPRLKMLGFGTEKIEEELNEIFPDRRIARMDQDTMRGKNSLERILTGFAQGAIDILVGTQMVTKGLDFDHVSVVGILNADNLMRFPDFRAHERAFQLMAQVAGRSGRRKTAGNVIIQAFDVHHPILDLVVRHDVDGMYEREIGYRRELGYPPFMRLIQLTLKHRDEERVIATAATIAMALREALGERVLGPEVPVVSRIRDKHLRRLLIKLRKSAHTAEKEFVRETIDRIFSVKEHAAVQLVTDVDPM